MKGEMPGLRREFISRITIYLWAARSFRATARLTQSAAEFFIERYPGRRAHRFALCPGLLSCAHSEGVPEFKIERMQNKGIFEFS